MLLWIQPKWELGSSWQTARKEARTLEKSNSILNAVRFLRGSTTSLVVSITGGQMFPIELGGGGGK